MRYKDIRNFNRPEKRNRQEDKISPYLFFLKIRIFQNLNQFGIYHKDTLLARADLHLLANLKKIEHILVTHILMVKLGFDLEKAKIALEIHTERIKYKENSKENLCRFATKTDNKILCTCCISCKYREWDYTESIPICDHVSTQI